MSTTTTTITGRDLAEQVLQTIDHRALSVADVAESAGLPVPLVEDLLHVHPERLDLAVSLRLADALRVPLSALVERAQQAKTADPRPVVDGGQVVTVWDGREHDAAAVYLGQIIDIDGPGVVLRREQVLNGSGRAVGERLTVTAECAETIRESVAAFNEASQE